MIFVDPIFSNEMTFQSMQRPNTNIAVFIAMPDGSGTNKGNCYFGDKDGDRIFTSFTGDIVAFKGDNTIIGGSGKYEGITGSGLWECDGSGEADDSAFNCRQNLTYKLP